METSIIQVINQLKLDARVQLTDNISEADALLALQSKLKKNPRIQAAAKARDIPIYVTKVDRNGFHCISTSHKKLIKRITKCHNLLFCRHAPWCR